MIVLIGALILFFATAACSKFDANDDANQISAVKKASVWVASPWQHVLRSSPPGELREVNVKAAANEYEAFRIIIHAGTLPLSEVNVSISSLKNNNGEIPEENIHFYRAHYLHITKPSYRSTNPADWYPDALIPFRDNVLRSVTYVAVPFNIEKLQNGEVWCDIYTHPGTQSGVYSGILSVTAGKLEVAKIPVNLTVWNFELPSEISMLSYFGKLSSSSASIMGVKSGTKEFRDLEDIYNRELLKHRAVPATPSYVWPSWSETTGIIENGEAERLKHIVETDHFNTLDIPFRYRDEPVKCRLFLIDIANWLRKLGYLDKSYIYMEDEPNDAAEYEIVRKQGALIKSADPGISRLCTEQTLTSNPAWGTLYGSVDIWCPLWSLWDETTARERLALGEKLWSYTALCQGPNGTPWWQIDMDPVNFRSPVWLSWHFDITGFLYWSSNYWSIYKTYQGVWEAPNFRPEYGYWGEGLLLYPGNPAGIYGFVPSIRLKLIREAMEDYEYMVLASRLGKTTEVDQIVNRIVTSFQIWSRKPEDYYLAREQLSNLIMNSK